jgi:hypothetical protein
LATVPDCHRHQYGYFESDPTTTPSISNSIFFTRTVCEAVALTLTALETVDPAAGLLTDTNGACSSAFAALPRSGSATPSKHIDETASTVTRERRNTILPQRAKQPLNAEVARRDLP